MKNALLIVLVLAIASPAAAQWGGDEKKGLFGIGGGFASPASDELDAFASGGFSISGFLARQLAGPLGWRVEGSYSKFGLDDNLDALCSLAGASCDDPSISHFNGGVQIGGFGDGGTSAYTLFTLGAYNVDLGDGADSATDFGLALGTGINWMVSDSAGVGVEFKIDGFSPEGDAGWQWYTETDFMVFFRF